MDAWIELFSEIFPVLGTLIAGLGGAFLGGWFTRKSQLDLFEKERTVSIEDYKRDKLEKCLEAYGEILKVDNVNSPINHEISQPMEFDFDIYNKEIQPLIYSNIAIIHQDVYSQAKIIDFVYSQATFSEEIDDADNMNVCNIYNKMIKNIENHLNNYRSAIHS